MVDINGFLDFDYNEEIEKNNAVAGIYQPFEIIRKSRTKVSSYLCL